MACGNLGRCLAQGVLENGKQTKAIPAQALEAELAGACACCEI